MYYLKLLYIYTGISWFGHFYNWQLLRIYWHSHYAVLFCCKHYLLDKLFTQGSRDRDFDKVSAVFTNYTAPQSKKSWTMQWLTSWAWHREILRSMQSEIFKDVQALCQWHLVLRAALFSTTGIHFCWIVLFSSVHRDTLYREYCELLETKIT